MVPPGGECEIKVTLRPKAGQTNIEKHIVVVSNDPVQPKLTLTMKGKLLVDVEAVPPSVQMMNLAPGEPGIATVSVERSLDSAATVTAVRVEDTKRFSIRAIETKPGALATYEVRFAGGEVGTASTNVIVETTGEHTPKLTIPVRAWEAARAELERDVVRLGAIEAPKEAGELGWLRRWGVVRWLELNGFIAAFTRDGTHAGATKATSAGRDAGALRFAMAVSQAAMAFAHEEGPEPGLLEDARAVEAALAPLLANVVSTAKGA